MNCAKWFAVFLCLAPLASGQRLITTIAGNDLVFQGDQQSGPSASLGRVFAVTVDPQGRPVFSDPYFHLVVRVNSSGALEVIAGNNIHGFSGDGGPAVAASLNDPAGLAYDAQGNLYIADVSNHRIRVVAPNGTISTFAGTGLSGKSDGPALSASFSLPFNVAVTSQGTVFVSDRDNQLIRKIQNGMVTTVAGTGSCGSSLDGPALGAGICDVEGIAVDSQGNLYIAEFTKHRVRKITAEAQPRIVTVAGTGLQGNTGDGGPALRATLDSPAGVAVDAQGNVYIMDANQQVLRRVDPNGNITTIAGTPNKSGFCGDGGPAAGACFHNPSYVALDSARNIFLADRDNFRVRRIDAQGTITTIAGNGRLASSAGDGGLAVQAPLIQPWGVVFDARNRALIVADEGSNLVRRIQNGIITTIAGTGEAGSGGDRGPALRAALFGPASVALDPDNNVVISDAGNNRVRRINPDGSIETIAGNGAPVFSGENASAIQAGLNGQLQIAYDINGVLYIADYFNNRVRKVVKGIITTVVSGANCPAGVAPDIDGSVYFSETCSGTVRKITPNGSISLVAGGGNLDPARAENQPATSARLTGPATLTLDNDGNLYIVEAFGNRVRRVDRSGLITTVAGNGRQAYGGDGGPATAASIWQPMAVAFDSSGAMYIADARNSRVRSVITTPGSLTVTLSSLDFTAASDAPPTDPARIGVNGGFAGGVAALLFDTSTSGDCNWLKISPSGGATPLALQLRADPAGVAAGKHRCTLSVNAPGATPPSRTVAVSFDVQPKASPKLSVANDPITATAVVGGADVTKTILIKNVGSGDAVFSALASTVSCGDWLAVSPADGIVNASTPTGLTLTVKSGALSPGTCSGTVQVTSGDVSTEVNVVVTATAAPAKIQLTSSALTFTAVKQGGAPLPQTIGVLNSSQGSMSWVAAVEERSQQTGWLKLSTNSGSVAVPNTDVSNIDVGIEPSALASLDPGTYYAQISIRSEAADNSPQLVVAALNLLPPDANPGPDIQTTNLVFTGTASNSPGSQTLAIANRKTGPLKFQTSRTVDWLTNAPTNGTLPSAGVARLIVQPKFDSLLPGVSTGQILITFEDNTTRTVTVTAFVPDAGSTAKTEREANGSCATKEMSLQLTKPPLVNDTLELVAGQGMTLEADLRDGCGNPLDKQFIRIDGTTADEAADPFVPVQTKWSGTYKFAKAVDYAQKRRVSAFSVVGGTPKMTQRDIFVSVRNPALPAPYLASQNIYNAASQAPSIIVAPGMYLSLYGDNLADKGCDGESDPLPTTLCGTTVNFGDKPMRLQAVRPGQVNALVPLDVKSAVQHVTVINGTTESSPINITVANTLPGIFSVDFTGKGQGNIYHLDGTLADAANPARPGEEVDMLCTGLGAVSGPLVAGVSTPTDQEYKVLAGVYVTIGGNPAQVVAAQLRPGLKTVYQVRVVVPDMPSDNAAKVVMTADGSPQPSSPVTMAVAQPPVAAVPAIVPAPARSRVSIPDR